MVRLLLLALAFLLVAAAPTPTPTPTPAPAPMLGVDAEERWIAFAPGAGGHIRFTALIDGRPVAAILDTGVSHSVLARTSAMVVQSRLAPAGDALAVGGSVPVSRMVVGRIEVGALVRDGGTLLVADLPATAAGGAPIDLLVGQDLIGGLALDIDYPGRRFRLLPSGRLPFVGETAPLATMPGRGLPLTALVMGGRRYAPILVDTGDGAAATLGPVAGAALPGGTVASVSWGLAGPVANEVAIAPTVSLGEATARGVKVRIEGADGLAGRLGIAGRIGSGLLSRYRVLIDPGAGRMVLRARDPVLAAR